MDDSTPRVIVVGGGFGGLAVTKALKRSPVRITLVDRSNHHLFQPLLYQVATAALAPSDIAEPIRSVLRRQDNAFVRLAEVREVDLVGKRVHIVEDDGDEEWIRWDKLVIAAGVSHSYFGNDQWAAVAPGLKTLGDAFEMRKRVLVAFERAEWTTDETERKRLTTLVVIGGGPTGVELAGALSEIAFHTLRRDFRNFEPSTARVILVEGGPALLSAYPERLRERAKEQLERLGVEVRLNAKVTHIDMHGVTLGEEKLPSATVLWAAGVKGEPIAATLGVPLDRSGRVPVNADCSVPGHPDCFVIGDLASMQQDGKPLPGVAQTAMQMGKYVARTIAGDLTGVAREPFRYRDLGSMATIGRSKAIADLGWWKTSGLPAWLLWAFIHILFLVTFRNKIVVMTKWAWAWFTYDRAVRLIWRPSQLSNK